MNFRNAWRFQRALRLPCHRNICLPPIQQMLNSQNRGLLV
jgi:hypothetical protein